MYTYIHIYIYIYIGSYKTTPTPIYRSGVKKITLFTPEGKTCTGSFLEIEGRTCNNTESAERCVCSKPLGGKLSPSLCHGVMAFVTEMFICTKPVLHLLWYETAAPPWAPGAPRKLYWYTSWDVLVRGNPIYSGKIRVYSGAFSGLLRAFLQDIFGFTPGHFRVYSGTCAGLLQDIFGFTAGPVLHRSCFVCDHTYTEHKPLPSHFLSFLKNCPKAEF